MSKRELTRKLKRIRLQGFEFQRSLFVLGVVVYIVAFHVSYIFLISPPFGYLGYSYRPDSIVILMALSVIALIPASWMPVRIVRPSQIIYIFLYFMAVIPAILVSAFAATLSNIALVKMSILLLGALAIIRVFYELPLLDLPRLKTSSISIWTFISIFGLCMYLLVFRQFGMSTNVPAISDVYSQRAEFREAVSGIGAYAFFWLAKAINPFLIAKGFLERNPVIFVVGLVGQIVLFGISGLKSVLFSVVLLVAVFLALTANGKNFGTWVVWGLSSLISVAAAIDHYLGISLTSSLFVRRLLAAPGLNTGYYFDYYSQQPNALLGHSVLSSVVDYPYEKSPAMTIGEAYYGDLGRMLDTSSNANLWADGYANFGVLGVIFFALLLGVLMWLTDSLANRRDIRLTTLILAYPAYALVNTTLHTTLLTHGFAIILVILYLLPRVEKDRPEKSLGQMQGAMRITQVELLVKRNASRSDMHA